jgi:hypothetical protein
MSATGPNTRARAKANAKKQEEQKEKPTAHQQTLEQLDKSLENTDEWTEIEQVDGFCRREHDLEFDEEDEHFPDAHSVSIQTPRNFTSQSTWKEIQEFISAHPDQCIVVDDIDWKRLDFSQPVRLTPRAP